MCYICTSAAESVIEYIADQISKYGFISVKEAEHLEGLLDAVAVLNHLEEAEAIPEGERN